MADEITLGELGRRLSEIATKVDGLPTRQESNVTTQALRDDIRRTNDSLTELKADLASVDGNSQRRHEKAEADISAEATQRRNEDEKIRSDMADFRDRADELERQRTNNRNGLIAAYVGVALAIIGPILLHALGVT